MYIKIFNDPDLEDFFKKTDKHNQKDMQRKFLTYLTGGSTEWHGKSMESAHEGRGITQREFDRVAFHVVTTL
jgi:hemoglobin